MICVLSVVSSLFILEIVGWFLLIQFLKLNTHTTCIYNYQHTNIYIKCLCVIAKSWIPLPTEQLTSSPRGLIPLIPWLMPCPLAFPPFSLFLHYFYLTQTNLSYSIIKHVEYLVIRLVSMTPKFIHLFKTSSLLIYIYLSCCCYNNQQNHYFNSIYTIHNLAIIKFNFILSFFPLSFFLIDFY